MKCFYCITLLISFLGYVTRNLTSKFLPRYLKCDAYWLRVRERCIPTTGSHDKYSNAISRDEAHEFNHVQCFVTV